MGKRFYCEFCDKSFPSNAENRKKHNEGVQHQKLRVAYYSAYKDLATTLYEEREKKPCHKYFSFGYCAFGELCRGSHRTPNQIEQLEDLYRIECHNKTKLEEDREKLLVLRNKKSNHPTSSRNPKEQETNLLSDYLTREEEEKLENFFPNYDLPRCLRVYSFEQLPLSVIPPEHKDLFNYEINSWTN